MIDVDGLTLLLAALTLLLAALTLLLAALTLLLDALTLLLDALTLLLDALTLLLAALTLLLDDGDKILLGFRFLLDAYLIHGLKFRLIRFAISGVAQISGANRIIRAMCKFRPSGDCRTLDVLSFSYARVNPIIAIKILWLWQHAIIH